MTLQFSRIQALLFDVDGTLSDTDNHMVERFKRWLRPFRWAFKKQDTQTFSRWLVMALASPGNFLYSLPDRFGFDLHLNRLFEWFARLKINPRNPADLFMMIKGVDLMLQELHTQYPMAVVSARNERTTRMFLQHFDLEKYFQSVVTAQTCQHTKPFPDPILYAAEQLGVQVENCLMIGDTMVDVHAALAAGAQSLSVLCGFGYESSLRNAGTHHVIEHTAQVDSLLVAGKNLEG